MLVTILIAMTQRFGHAQAPVASREAMSPSSTIAHVGSGETRSRSIDQPSDQMATSLCRLQVQDTFPQPPRTPQNLRRRSEPWTTPPCPHVVSSTCFWSKPIRPTRSCQQAFRRLWTKPRGNGPTMEEECKIGRSDLGRLWRIQNRGGSSRPLLCRRSCIRIPAIFRRTRELSLPGLGIRRPEWWSPGTTPAIAHSTRPSSWALWPPVRYKTLTTHDLTELSGIP